MALASNFAFYNSESNSIVVDAALTDLDVGYYKIRVESSEVRRNQTYSYEKFIYMRVVKGKPSQSDGPPAEVETPKKHGFLSIDQLIRESVEESTAKPLPVVLGLNPTGVLTIGWSNEMSPPAHTDLAKLTPDAKILAYAEAGLQSGRLLSDEASSSVDQVDRKVFANLTEEELDSLESRIIALPVLDVQVMDEYGDVCREELKPDWSVQRFDSQRLTIQLIFSDVNRLEPGDQVSVTFWGTHFFADKQDREVPFGAEVRWELLRQMQLDEKEQVDEMLTYSFGILSAGAFFSLVLVLSCGPLLPLWMFINSMQLILHLPLIRSQLPGAANFFLLAHLELVRLHLASVNEFTAPFFGDPTLDDAKLAADPDAAFYSPLLHQCGYSFAMWPNLSLTVLFLLVLALTWVLTLAIDFTRMDKVSKINWEPLVSNFAVRFLYQVFFEIVISTLIALGYSGEAH